MLLGKYYLCPTSMASMRIYCLSALHLRRTTIRNIMSGVYRRIAATSSKVQNVNYATTNAHIFVFVQRVYVPCKDRIFEIYIEKFLGFFLLVCMCVRRTIVRTMEWDDNMYAYGIKAYIALVNISADTFIHIIFLFFFFHLNSAPES